MLRPLAGTRPSFSSLRRPPGPSPRRSAWRSTLRSRPAVKLAESLEVQAKEARARAADAFTTFDLCEKTHKEAVAKLASEVVEPKETIVVND
eukprot:9084899-Pyramimonas_sp.AAC.1